MAKFNEVFSTTAKVVLSLMLISLIIGIAYYALGGAGSIVQAPQVDQAQIDADEIRTRMPQSKWDTAILKAVQVHCVTDGMSEEEVVRSYGEPTKKSDYGGGGSEWVWALPPGECLKYEGDNCVDRRENQKRIEFTAKGNVFKLGSGCASLDDHYYSYQDLFASVDVPRERPKPARVAAVRQPKKDDMMADKALLRSCENLRNTGGYVSPSMKDECDAAADRLSDHGYTCYVDGHCEKKSESQHSITSPKESQPETVPEKIQ